MTQSSAPRKARAWLIKNKSWKEYEVRLPQDMTPQDGPGDHYDEEIPLYVGSVDDQCVARSAGGERCIRNARHAGRCTTERASPSTTVPTGEPKCE